jgi:tetratricopeptide (TPR) repeat protein
MNNKIHINVSKPPQKQLNSLLEFYQAGRYVDAEKLSLSITEEFPKHQFAWKVLGAIFKHKGRISESLIASQKSVELGPLDAEAHNNLGNTLKELGRLNESEASYSQAIALKPDLAEAHNNLGITLKELGRLNESEASLRQTIKLKPDLAEAHNNLGITLKELGRLNESEASLRQTIKLKPDYAEAHNNLGITLKELGRLNESEASYSQAIALKPDYAEAHYNLGITLKELGRLNESEASFRQAIALKPDKFADAYDQLGVILQKRGEFEEAEVCYKKCMSLEPNKITKTLSKGSIFFKQGHFEQALIAFENYDDRISKAQILETLYALGRIDEIHERIEARADLDDQNLRVSAFAAFLADREKKDNAHRFCNNPIEFIHFTNISSHIRESECFIASLIDELRHVKTGWEINTTKKGFQASANVFANPLEKMGILKSIIIDEIDTYYSKFKNKSCSYIKKWPSEINIDGWHVVLKQQGHQTRHIHPDGWLSGVIYLMVVPSLGKDEGTIEFTLDSQNYLDASSLRKKYQPRLGDIVFFPSSLHHRTLPFSTDMDRICISFDLMPTSVKH